MPSETNPHQNLAASWEVFVEELKRSLEMRGARPERITVQVQLALACSAVSTLLFSMDQKGASSKFQMLASALLDTAGGVPNRLVMIDDSLMKKPGRRNDTGATWRFRAFVCIGLEFMNAAGLSKAEAIKRTERKLRGTVAKSLRSGADAKKSLAGWQKSFASGTVRNEGASLFYKVAVGRIDRYKSEEMSGEFLQRMGEQFIEQAIADAKQITSV